jgi:hypothetical protein
MLSCAPLPERQRSMRGNIAVSQNVGTIDRAVRIVLGLALLALAVFGGQWWGWIGVVPLVTAFMGFCPAYKLVGLSTCPIAPRKA